MSLNNPSRTEDTVSQAEVERLLADIAGLGTADLGSAAALRIDDTPLSHCEPLQRHTFPGLSFFSTTDLRRLRVRSEEFIRALTARLSISHRLDLALRMSKLETLPFPKFVDMLSNPTFVAHFRLEPLAGACLVDIPAVLGLQIVDCELGGSGNDPENIRELSDVEARLLSRVVETTLTEWCSFWSSVIDLRPLLMGHESTGRFLDVCSPDTTMLVLGIEVGIGEMIDQIQFAFPHQTMEPLVAKLNSNIQGAEKQAAGAGTPLRWNQAMDDVRIRITARLPDVELSARQLAQLKPGDIIPLTPDITRHIRVNLEEVPKFTATLGTHNKSWAVKIDRSLKSERLEAQNARP